MGDLDLDLSCSLSHYCITKHVKWILFQVGTYRKALLLSKRSKDSENYYPWHVNISKLNRLINQDRWVYYLWGCLGCQCLYGLDNQSHWIFYTSGLEFRKMSSTAIPRFFAVVNAFFNLNFLHSLWQKNCTTAIALCAFVEFESCTCNKSEVIV
jgi:hypothetical protein